jgi:hypothetical protein
VKPVWHCLAWPETAKENCDAVWFFDAVFKHAVRCELATCWTSAVPPEPRPKASDMRTM